MTNISASGSRNKGWELEKVLATLDGETLLNMTATDGSVTIPADIAVSAEPQIVAEVICPANQAIGIPAGSQIKAVIYDTGPAVLDVGNMDICVYSAGRIVQKAMCRFSNLGTIAEQNTRETARGYGWWVDEDISIRPGQKIVIRIYGHDVAFDHDNAGNILDFFYYLMTPTDPGQLRGDNPLFTVMTTATAR